MKELHELLKYKKCYYYDYDLNEIGFKLDDDSDDARELYEIICKRYFKCDRKVELDTALSIACSIDNKYMNVITTYLGDEYLRNELYNRILYNHFTKPRDNIKRYTRHVVNEIIEIVYAIVYEDYDYKHDVKKDYYNSIDYDHLKLLYYDTYKHIFELIEQQLDLDMFICSEDAVELLIELIKNELDTDIFINEIVNKFKYMINSYNDYYNHYNEFKNINYFPIHLFTHEYNQFMCLCELGFLKLIEHNEYNIHYVKEFIRRKLNLRDEDILLHTRLFECLYNKKHGL